MNKPWEEGCINPWRCLPGPMMEIKYSGPPLNVYKLDEIGKMDFRIPPGSKSISLAELIETKNLTFVPYPPFNDPEK